MPKVSAGLLMFREREGTLEVLLAHPGGPYFRNRDEGSWTIPKGIVERGEEPLDAAFRSVAERHDLKLGKLAQPVRVAIVGTPQSPGIFETLAVLGRDRSLRRIDAALDGIAD